MWCDVRETRQSWVCCGAHSQVKAAKNPLIYVEVSDMKNDEK